jgi:protein-L-isoaspartate O-methyltransferase
VPAAEPVKEHVVRGRPVLCEMAPWDCVHVWKQAEDAPPAVVNHHGYDGGLAWPVVDQQEAVGVVEEGHVTN